MIIDLIPKMPEFDNVIVAVPIVSSDSYTYDGNQKSITFSNVDPAYVLLSDNTKTNAGSYVCTASLINTDATWSDGTKEDKTYNWSIAKATITLPTVTNTQLSYSGSAQGPTIESYDTTKLSVTGNSATNVGSYTVIFSLIDSDNYQMSGTNNVPWSIGKATLTVPTVTNTSKTYNGAAQSPTITGFDSTKMNKTGDSETNAGSYTVAFTLKDTNNYQWNSATTSFSWSIGKLTITKDDLNASPKSYMAHGSTSTGFSLSIASTSTLPNSMTISPITLGKSSGQGSYSVTITNKRGNAISKSKSMTATLKISGRSGSHNYYTIGITASYAGDDNINSFDIRVSDISVPL